MELVLKQDIARDWGSTPVANVQFRSLGSGGVINTVSKVRPPPCLDGVSQNGPLF